MQALIITDIRCSDFSRDRKLEARKVSRGNTYVNNKPYKMEARPI